MMEIKRKSMTQHPQPTWAWLRSVSPEIHSNAALYPGRGPGCVRPHQRRSILELHPTKCVCGIQAQRECCKTLQLLDTHLGCLRLSLSHLAHYREPEGQYTGDAHWGFNCCHGNKLSFKMQPGLAGKHVPFGHNYYPGNLLT